MSKFCRPFVMLLTFLCSCAKDSPDVESTSLLLSKIEIFFLSQASQLNEPASKDASAQNFYTFTYDEQGRLLSEQYSNLDAKGSVVPNFAYFLEYGKDGKISKIRSTKPAVTAEYIWSDRTILVRRIFDDGSIKNVTIALNEAGLPISRTDANYTVKLELDTKGNVMKRWEGDRLAFEAIEYDTTKLNPFTTSYELRILSQLTSLEGFMGQSRHLIRKYKESGYAVENKPYLVEYNTQKYPTLTGSLGPPVIRTKYTYVSK